MRRLLALFFILNFSVACNKAKVPAGIIQPDKMVNLLTDMHIADGYTANHSFYNKADSDRTASVYKAVFKKHATDSAGMRKSLAFYSKNPKQLQDLYKKVGARLANLEKAEQARIKKEENRKKVLEAKKKKKEKLRLDSLRKDSLNRVNLKKDSLNKVKARKDSLKRLSDIKKEKTKNDIPAKRNR